MFNFDVVNLFIGNIFRYIYKDSYFSFVCNDIWKLFNFFKQGLYIFDRGIMELFNMREK